MSLPRPPAKHARLPYDGTLDEVGVQAYAELGWDPVDIRTLDSSLDTCRLVLLGVRMGTVTRDRAQMEALELEIRVNGGFTSKAGENLEAKGGRRDLPKDEIGFLSIIPQSKQVVEASKEAEKATRGPTLSKNGKRMGRPRKSEASEPKGSELASAIASQMSAKD